MESTKQRVLIVGAGLTGLTLYRALDKSRFDIDVVEKQNTLHHLGYAISLAPTGIAALEALNYSPRDIANLGRPIHENCLRNAEGEITSKTNFLPWVKEFGAAFRMVAREDLYRLLEKGMPMQKIQCGTSPISLQQTTDGITVRLRNNQEQKYDAVIGADGAHSFVRQYLTPKATPKETGISGIWAWVPRSDLFTNQAGGYVERNSWVLFFDTGDQEKICVFFGVPNQDVPDDIAPRDYTSFLQNHFKNFKMSVPKVLSSLPGGEQMYLHRDLEVNTPNWHIDNVGLLGDAAHARSVLTGFGSGLAIEDAVLLARLLNDNGRFEEAFAEFEAKQKPRVETLALSTLFKTKKIGDILHNFLATSFLFS